MYFSETSIRENFFVSGTRLVGIIGVSGILDTDDGRRWADDGLLKGCSLIVGVLFVTGTLIILATGA